jgi:hypothetical protein
MLNVCNTQVDAENVATVTNNKILLVFHSYLKIYLLESDKNAKSSHLNVFSHLPPQDKAIRSSLKLSTAQKFQCYNVIFC